jgi:hypothetical protein
VLYDLDLNLDLLLLWFVIILLHCEKSLLMVIFAPSLLGPYLLLLLFEIMKMDESVFLPWRSYQDSNGKTYILLHIFNTKNGLFKWYKHSILYKKLIKSTYTSIELIVIENCIQKYQHHYVIRIFFFIQLTTQTIQWSQLRKWFFLSYKCNQAHYISYIVKAGWSLP